MFRSLFLILALAGLASAQSPQCFTPYRAPAKVTYLPLLLSDCQPGTVCPPGQGCWQCPPGACPNGGCPPYPGAQAGTPYQPVFQPPLRVSPCPGGVCPSR